MNGKSQTHPSEFVAVCLSHIQASGSTLGAALGVTASGEKQVLSIVTAPNYASALPRLFHAVAERVARQEMLPLFVVDDDEEMVGAARQQFGPAVLIQRCVRQRLRSAKASLGRDAAMQFDLLSKALLRARSEREARLCLEYLQKRLPANSRRALARDSEQLLCVFKLMESRSMRSALRQCDKLRSFLDRLTLSHPELRSGGNDFRCSETWLLELSSRITSVRRPDRLRPLTENLRRLAEIRAQRSQGM